MRRTRRKRLKGLPFNKMIPNILTLMALAAGMTSIRFALEERWEHSVIALVAAAVLDGLDGRIARLLKGSSKFGAELDSLSDFICFGVAPAIVLYLWTMEQAGRLGWALVVLYAVCCALRLARFNTKLDEPDLPPWAYNFFSGVPAPGAGGLVILPMMLHIETGSDIFRQPAVVAAFLIVVALLMISRVPTYAAKAFKVPPQWVLPTMLFVAFYWLAVVNAPWVTFSTSMILYALSIPFAMRSFRSLKRQAEALRHRPDPKDGDAPPPLERPDPQDHRHGDDGD